MLMEANKKPLFAEVLRRANLVTPDGKPLVLMLHRLGIKHQNQVAGMDVFLNLCDLAEQTGISVYFLGSTESTLRKMKQKLDRDYPLLQVAGMKEIPFVPVEEINRHYDRDLVEEINQSGAGIVFVCLGCPKQEIWMSQYQGAIKGVMVGIGAVFSMYAGINPRAPYWMRQVYLEWLYRLLQEPHRLWQRYSSTIPHFMYLATKQLLIPHQGQLSPARYRALPEMNMVVELETMDFSPRKLGEILIRQNAISKKQLEQALAQQQLNPNLKIGEILVRNNSISLPQLKFYLKNQNIKLGELLIERKIIKMQNLNRVLQIQNQAKSKLGEILVEQKIISLSQLKDVLINQYTRRKGLYLADWKHSNQEDLLGIKPEKIAS